MLSPPAISVDGETRVRITVSNTGPRAGVEIVQLYVRDRVSSATRAVKELKDFVRVGLEPGESDVVEFTIDASKLAFWNAEMKYVVEPGTFDIMIGRSSHDVQSVELMVW